MSIPNHLDTVQTGRALYNDRAGLDRAHAICSFVTWELRSEPEGSWGRFLKADGTLSADVIALRVANQTFVNTYDILEDSENRATPQWGPTQPTGRGDLSRWRAASPPPDPSPRPPDPPDPPPDASDLEDRVAALEAALRQQTEAIRLLTAAQTKLAGRVEALEQKPPNVEAAVDAVVAGVVVAFHETGRASWPPHRHGIDAGVPLTRK